MADIGSLIVKIGADASGLQKAFTELGGSAKQFQNGLGNLAKIGGAAFIAVAASMTAMTIAAGQQAEALQQLSSITGISTDTLQEYEVLLGRVGLGADDLVGVFRKLSKNLEDARNGTGNAADRFRQLGIDITRVTSTDDLLRKLATSISTMASGTEKAAIAGDLMGRSGLKFIPAFEGGAKAIDEAAAASVRLGAALSSGQLAELGAMDDKIDDLTIAWKRFGQQLGSFVAPAIEFTANLLSNLLSMASHGLKDLNALGGVTAAADARKKPPPLIDTAKQSAQAQSLLDAQLKSQESYHADSFALAQAANSHEMALIDQRRAVGISSEFEAGTARQQQIARMDAFTESSLVKQLDDYRKFVDEKSALFTHDAKGRADLAKFEEESHSKELSMITKISIAQGQADTNRIESGLRVTTFWQQQLKTIADSNAFSVSQIISTWTGGLANAIVNGGNFVKAAWQSTQLAIVQGAINTGVQLAAQWLLQASVEKGILAAQLAARLGLVSTGTTAQETAKTGIVATGEAARLAIVIATNKAVTASVILSLGAMATIGEAALAIMAAVTTAAAAMMSAIAAALTAGIITAELAPPVAAAAAVLLAGGLAAAAAGSGAIQAALGAAIVAAAAGGGFATGGIGDFGSGTQTTLHGPEAIIPLNQRGASFMREAFGGGPGGDQIIHTHVILDGRQIALAVSDRQPEAFRTMGVL